MKTSSSIEQRAGAAASGAPATKRIHRTVRATRLPVLFVMLLIAVACGAGPSVLVQQVDARRYATDLQAAFLQSTEAGNRAVMADTDDASAAAVKEAAAASDRAAQAVATLEPLLQSLNYGEEIGYLATFKNRFEEYRKLDAEILPLAVENTNLKAQRLSFGPAQEASDAFNTALAAVGGSNRSADVEAQVAMARAAVLEVQVIEARHIAEPEEAAMNRMEQRMDALLADARSRMRRLRELVPRAATQVAAAETALDRFAAVNGELIGLSRRNTNVRSLALSLGRKRVIAAECEDQLRALIEAISRHQFHATR
jgi:hypothetical protein